MENYTKLSQEMYDIAVQLTTVCDASKVLRETGKFRSLKCILQTFTGCEEPKAMLVERLLPWNPTIGRESVSKKVRTWLAGKTQSVGKKDAFILARALELSREDADLLLKQITGEGIHWRDPEEIVWSYAIVHRLNFDQVNALMERVMAIGKAAKPVKTVTDSDKTEAVKDKVLSVLNRSEEELVDFLTREWDRLGKYHNTAYSLFTEYMGLLQKGHGSVDLESKLENLPEKERKEMERFARERLETARMEAAAAGRVFDPDADPDGQDCLLPPDKITTRDILEDYLYRKFVPVAERGNERRAEAFSAIQRSIRLNWPDEFAISKMSNRQQDVTRKVLMLLFLATDGGESDFREVEQEIPEEDWELYEDVEPEDDPTPDEVFDSLKTRMNLMLKRCGYQELDPRSPFDWMILFCISSGDLWEADTLLQDMLQKLFPQETEE